MIPKTFHRIWLGDKPFPPEFAKFAQGWAWLHRDWQHCTWTDADIGLLTDFPNADLLPICKNAAQRSDVLRYEILWQQGGVYLDTDFECLKNIEPLLTGEFVGAGEKPDMLSAGFIACRPRHPLVGRVREKLRERLALPGHQAKTTGPGLLTEVWQEFKSDPAVVTYGPELFYPYAFTEKHRRQEAFPDAYAVHHWAGSWL